MGTEVWVPCWSQPENQILQAEMTFRLGASPEERTDDRQGYRNVSYRRKLTTRVGRLELEVPRDREGRFQTALFQRQERSEKALVLVLMQMVVQGVSTRRVKEITTKLCGREFSKSTVSRLPQGLNEQVQAWASRSFQENSYPFLVLDAMHLKVRRQGAVRSTTVILAVGVNEEGQREILVLLWRPLGRWNRIAWMVRVALHRCQRVLTVILFSSKRLATKISSLRTVR